MLCVFWTSRTNLRVFFLNNNFLYLSRIEQRNVFSFAFKNIGPNVERRLLDFRFIFLTCIYVSRNISLNTKGCSLKKMIIMLSLFYLKDLLSWYKEWSIVPIIQTPERIQLKYRLNISQQILHIIHVMSGDVVTYSSIAKSSSRSYLLRNN